MTTSRRRNLGAATALAALLAAAGCGGDDGPAAGTTTLVSPPTTRPPVFEGVVTYRQVPAPEWSEEDRVLAPELATWQARVTSTLPPRRVRVRYSSGSCPSRPWVVRAVQAPTSVSLSLTFDESECPRFRPDILLFVVLEIELEFDIDGRPVQVSTLPPVPRTSGAT